MENPIIFLNHVPEDKAVAERLKAQLQKSGFSVVMPDEVANLQAMDRLLKDIETVTENNGLMVLVLSKHAVKNNLLISNTQYFCELAGKRQTLLICKIEEVPRENPVALYYPRAVTVNASSDEEKWMPKVLACARQLAGLPGSSFTSPKRISKRTLQRLSIAVAILAILGGIGSFFLDFYKERQAIIEAAEAAAQAPVMINEPFQNESIDQGLVVDQRSLPSYTAEGDPSADAPFSFEPTFIHQQFTFDDPQFENVLDYSMIGIQNVSIREEDFRLVNQQKGVLHIAATTSEEITQSINLPINYYFSTSDVNYVGVRFRIDPYVGWTQADKPIMGIIGLNELSMGVLDFSTQTLSSSDNTVFIGTNWHTLEARIFPEDNLINVFLDGKLFAHLREIPAPDQVVNLRFFLEMQYSTDWANLFVDEIIIGGDAPLDPITKPEEIQFNFTIDEPAYQYTFDDTSIYEFIIENSGSAIVSDGILTVHFEQGRNDQFMTIQIPSSSIDRINYYALKYRIVETPVKLWTYNGSLDMRLKENKAESTNLVSYQTSLHSAELRMQSQTQENGQIDGQVENPQDGGWHTLEMLLLPAGNSPAQFKVQFWFDHFLIREQDLQNPESLIGGSSPLVMRYTVSGGDLSFGPITLELDDLTSGYVPPAEALE